MECGTVSGGDCLRYRFRVSAVLKRVWTSWVWALHNDATILTPRCLLYFRTKEALQSARNAGEAVGREANKDGLGETMIEEEGILMSRNETHASSGK
jgi:hypothetical protein